uniref:histidine--tRNA ligase n=1 Tax=Sphondylothamnion multifidum TaxID=193186 RepID=A0A4D6X0T8_9FLOR|nr:Histidine-tRNA ligase [Sphondylothamnion multifidum]
MDTIQQLRGTKDILPKEIEVWQYIYNIAYQTLITSNYCEIRTPILEQTSLFKRSIGDDTDIVNKEMYSFQDQGKRNITLRPEGTASIARAFINNKLYNEKNIQRLWYLGPMFRYERPQKGRQRQFHQLGIECIGSYEPIADAEVIRIATKLLKKLHCTDYTLEINCIGNFEERHQYKEKLLEYLITYHNSLDEDSQKRLHTNPLRILDSKNTNTQEILSQAPKLKSYLSEKSRKHFEQLCQYLEYSDITYTINDYLIRGLDYYNNTAFEIKTNLLGQQNTICGGGRYDDLIQQIGGPKTPAVGWAIGIERLIMLTQKNLKYKRPQPIYLAIQGNEAKKNIWYIISLLEKYNIAFKLDLSNNNFNKQIKTANKNHAEICFIIGENEANNNYITIKWLNTGLQKYIKYNDMENYLAYIKKFITT